MVRITKTIQPKHLETLSPFIGEFVKTACSISLPLLPQHLSQFPTRWPFPRGDLYHWISLLNRFDVILERFCTTYKLSDGPQKVDFGREMLESNVGEAADDAETHNLPELGYGEDGDRQLIEAILKFSKMLLENCGNRSIYSSSPHLGSLLNTTSLSLLENTLLVTSQLAQRYNSAMKRVGSARSSKHLLAEHYNIDLNRVLQLSLPFSKTITTPPDSAHPTTTPNPTTPGAKGKEKDKAYFSLPISHKSSTTIVYANDLVSIYKGGSGVSTNTKSPRRGSDNTASPLSQTSWDEWGDVRMTYYPKTKTESEPANNAPKPADVITTPVTPVTPTPVRRSSNLGPNAHRPNRSSTTEEAPPTLARAPTMPADDAQRQNAKTIEISSTKLRSTDIYSLMEEYGLDLPQDLQYELFTKIRIAKALISSLETRQQALAIRMLAVANMANVYAEPLFLENIMKQDGDEPKRLQFIYQVADLVHPPAEGDIAVSIYMQTLAFSTLEAIAGISTKFQDVCKALNTTINHGVMLYVIRKAVAEMAVEDLGDKLTEKDQWRNALFSLMTSLCQYPRTAEGLVTAGLIPIMIEILGLRTTVAQRYQPKTLSFLDNVVYSAREAFQILVNANGLDRVSDLIVHETTAAAAMAESGNGMPIEHRSPSTDYEIPFYQQQVLKWLFKFIHHMMSSANSYGGNFDRILRNLIDSSQLLGSLRQIIGNARCFGSIVWTNAVGILNGFINNEPTSFAIIAEAGLSKGFLEAVTGRPIQTLPPSGAKKRRGSSHLAIEGPDGDISTASSDEESDDEPFFEVDTTPHPPTLAMLQAPREGPLARGILPTQETINIVPQAFSALCLNGAGMRMFRASRALESFFEIFESPEHVKCMESSGELPSSLGGTFDELVRHHPPLKGAIINAILDMVVRVGYLCKIKAEKDRAGVKLWEHDSTGNVVPIGASSSSPSDVKGKGKADDSGSDVEMRDADEAVPAPVVPKDSDTSMTAYITSVASFLATVLNNPSVRTEFCARGGIEYVLDLAESQSLPANFGDGISGRNLQNVIALLAEQKPYLVIPSLLKRAQAAADVLQPFATHNFSTSFFAPFVDKQSHDQADKEILAQGTAFAKAFVNVQSLVSNLTASIQGSPYSHRNTPSGFNSMNFADHYNRLIQTLGPLLGASIKEEILLQTFVPKSWQQISPARIKDSLLKDVFPEAVITEPSHTAINALVPGVEADSPSPSAGVPGPVASQADVVEANPVPDTSAKPSGQSTQNSAELQASGALKNSAQYRNYQTFRYLLGKTTRVISPFFQNVGKVLLSKRNPDPYYRQNHTTIAEALSESILNQLARPGNDNSAETYSYWIELLHVLKDMLIDSSRHTDRQIQTISIVLQAFKERSGFTTLNRILEAFTSEIRAPSGLSPEQQEQEKTPEKPVKHGLAAIGAKQIISMYSILANSKHVTEVPQTLAMIPRNERERERARLDSFTPGQFMVELRMAILPTVRRLWESDLIEKAPSQISEVLIEVIRTIASTEGEGGAIRRTETQPTRQPKSSRKAFKINPDNVNALKDQGYDEDLAKEALYRCNNNLATSTDYCKEQKRERSRGRCPIPEDDIEVAPEPSGNSRPSSGSTGSASPSEQPAAISSAHPDVTAIINSLQTVATVPASGQVVPPGSADDPFTPQGFNRMMNQLASGYDNKSQDASHGAASSAPLESLSVKPTQSAKAEEPAVKQVTVDDLNDERKLIRENLIDKCLDVINAHGDVTFEISDLITTVVNKSPDHSGLRKVVAETLVVALMSFAGAEDVRTDGNKIAAYAHLLALMLREKQFYVAAVGELQENLSTLLTFVKLSPSHSAEEPSPWIAQILLIVEMLLSEDAKPRKAKWTPPKDENEKTEAPIFERFELAVSEEERSQLLESILDILPRIGKEESLALAILRILVILTRTRSIAQAMGEKKNIQRLFVMAKQLAGASSTRIHSPLLLILRHIVEDDETIKQIMRSDIKAFFDHNVRPQRSPIDLQLYLRGLQHVANRAPALFVQVTNEMVKFTGWPLSPDPTSRSPSLVLKGDPLAENTSSAKNSEDTVQPTVQATEDLSLQDLKPSTEFIDTDMPDVGKAASSEHKTPVVENPDGVIHFLLCELLNYKDVEDKDRSTTSSTEKAASSAGDVSMIGAPSVPDSPALKDGQSTQESTKQEFKADEHPIYIYRCFLLQCLTELLSSYNRTKIEFINFKRSAPPQAMTPSKPRSSVLHYLLADLLPIGTLDYAENTAIRKKLTTSHWADSVITALLNKTGEQILDKSREQSDGEDEPDLLFVRRFVLENILKAYKDASASTEPLEVKYARMLSLADLMMHIMTGKDNLGTADTSVSKRSQMQLKRIMFEKGYIAALTASVADIDLNFPGAKRAVKYILRPLKQLTHHAIYLSENSLISSPPGQADEDDIESATSVSDLEDEREETPDLFRNSTLGMFEQGDENDTSSDSEDDDEDMYEGEYDDGMEYEDEMEQDDEENVSDEDEDDDGMGPIEGLSGDHGVDVEVIMEDEEDDDDDDDDDDDSEDEEEEDDDDDDEHGSEEMEDDDARIEILDEAGNVQELAEDDDLDDWESDNDEEMEEDDEEEYEEGYEGQGEDNEQAHVHSMGDMGPIGNLVRVLAGAGDEEDAVEMLQRLEEEGVGDPEDDEEEPLGEYMEEMEEEEDEDDEDDVDEEMLFEHAYPGQSNIRPSSTVRLIDQADGPGPIFGWEGDVEPPMVISNRVHQGRHRHAFPSPFPFLPGGSRDPLGGRLSQLSELEATSRFAERRVRAAESAIPGRIMNDQPGQNRTDRFVVPDFRYRAHRSGAPPPYSTDDGTNPLLQRNGPSGSNRPGYRGPQIGSWIQAPGPGALIDMSSVLGGRAFGDSPEQILDMIRSLRIPGSMVRNGQALQFHITASPGQLPRELEAMFGTRRPRTDNHRDTSEPGSATSFTTQCTAARWSEESKLLFGPSNVEIAQELKIEIMAGLVPPAIEADKVMKAAEMERIRALEEEKKKRLEAEKLAREAKEAEEKAAREKKEADEKEAAERAAAELAAIQNAEADEQTGESIEASNATATDAMEGVQSEAPEPATNTETQGAEVPAADRPRVMTVIRGNPFDITDLGIDAEFLAELPDEIREEVIMAAVAERRQQATATGSQPTDIDQEFLDALPDDIREEIMQQEAQERRRRERNERREAAAASGGGPPNVDMDLPSILATFSPALRQEVLMDGDEDFMASLPPDLAAQARQLRRGQPDHPGHPGRASVGVIRRPAPGEEIRGASQQPRARRAIVQMLDKQGVATLLRLMFIFQHSSFRSTLNSVLQNVALNKHNRAELISTLLHILQDGSADMTAIERSFSYLSVRAKQPKEKDPKTPTQTLRRTLTGLGSLAQTNSEASPLMVVQQCLTALVYLAQTNLHVASFFLTEHEPSGGLKRSLSRKGKGKDSKAPRYALNSLLSLLDRDLIMESATIMEQLSLLLNIVTSPLIALERKQKEAIEEAERAKAAAPANETAEATGSTEAPNPETVTTGESTSTEQPQTSSETAAPAENSSGDSTAAPALSTLVIPTNADSGEASAGPETDSSKPADASKQEHKKIHVFTPPVVPEHNLRLVTNIFCCECNSKTFRETISTIKNLSTIPGAKTIFGKELIAKARALGEVILVDLQDLLPQIQKARTGTEIQGVALAKFSPPASDQHKLLRVLTALDHLFDPKREKKDDSASEAEDSEIVEKQDLLSSLYENSTFGPMWEKLSACLSTIRQQDHMLSVATILLPLIESLMVVCKNTTLKDAPLSRAAKNKEMVLASPVPESRMENLFFSFTEEHRKILNDLVRHTPKLMSGTFSLLVKNPKVLEFDNKRNYFSRSIHSRSQGSRAVPPLQLSVRREQVFHDSFKSLYFQTPDQMKYGKLSIRFHGEEGVDAGGVTREWFQVLSRQMFDPGYALFIPVSSDRTTFHPNQLSSINEEHLMFFKFIGRIIGKALYEGRVLDCHFSRAVYKRILGKAVSVKDMESLDPDYYKSLIWMLENDITDIITETFSVDNDKFGVVETIDFIENGRNVAVTEENKHEYVRLMVEWKLTGSVKAQLDEFLKGFHDIIPAELVSIFNEQELELLISGLPEIDVDDWKSNTEYHNYSASSPQIQWFWRAVRSYDKEERAKLLQFVTGTSKVPLNGFKELEGMNGFSRFNIHRDYGNKERLPSSHTCFNQLDLPEYESYETLRAQVLTAITAGSEYFGFA